MIRTILIAGLLLSCAEVMAQKPAPSPKEVSPPARTLNEKKRAAPQVVTIVHRLNGLKMFRLLSRSEEQVQAIAGLDSNLSLMDDVYTNVIAGLALEDGETIAAWLPEAEVEFPRFAVQQFKGALFDPPDVSVIGPDGKQLLAKYVGLDAVTGLSILRLTGASPLPAAAMKDDPIDVGENVLLFGPEPVRNTPSAFGGNLYVRMGAIEGRILNVLPAPSGEVARFKISAPRLSQAKIGGVAVNEAGETLGIVDGLEGNEASILPAAAIRRAARRVLEQQASVPRPWLGVQGEAIAALKLDQILKHGWELQRASLLAENHQGILLTSIMPGSPAALAALRAGDVILKVDGKEIQNEQDFTWWLEQAGPSTSVRFTVARPDRPSEEALNVKLSGMLNPTPRFNLRPRFPSGHGALIEHGIETIALRPVVATQLGATAGLLVVYVEPSTPAYEAGLRSGDVIQTINGKPPASASGGPLTLEVTRKKEKIVIKVEKATKQD